MIVLAISVWHPIASIVTVVLRKSMVRKSSGMAVISLDLSAIFFCLSTNPSSDSQALTVWMAGWLRAVSKLRRLVLPSTARCRPEARERTRNRSIQPRKTALNASASSAPNTARNTSCVGVP